MLRPVLGAPKFMVFMNSYQNFDQKSWLNSYLILYLQSQEYCAKYSEKYSDFMEFFE